MSYKNALKFVVIEVMLGSRHHNNKNKPDTEILQKILKN